MILQPTEARMSCIIIWNRTPYTPLEEKILNQHICTEEEIITIKDKIKLEMDQVRTIC